MIKVNVGLKGSGKTSSLVNAVNNAVKEEKGNVVCITKDNRLLYDLTHKARLVQTEQFEICSYEMFQGFICGIISRDFDITHIFIDSIMKIVKSDCINDFEAFLDTIEKISTQFSISFTITVSADPAAIPESIKKYTV